jgi:myo-inositol 2-dehydrogenase/D-chiro-inositol 1-dehydrogenase
MPPFNKPKRTRIGLIGFGYIGRTHFRALRELPQVEIGWICTRSANAAHDLAKELPNEPPTFTAYVEAISHRPRVDGVVVATPTMSHLEIGRAVIREGLPCFMEKPLTASASDSLVLAQDAEAAGVQHMTGFRLRYFDTIVQLKRYCAETRFLEIRMFDDPWVGDFWKFQPHLGGGNVLDQYCHCVDLIRFISGARIVSLSAKTASLNGAGCSVDHVAVCFTLSNGGLATVMMGDSGISPLLGKFSIEVTATTWRASAYKRFTEAVITNGKVQHTVKASEEKVNRVQMQAFVELVRGNEIPVASFWDGYQADFLLEKTIESGTTGRSINLTQNI